MKGIIKKEGSNYIVEIYTIESCNEESGIRKIFDSKKKALNYLEKSFDEQKQIKYFKNNRFEIWSPEEVIQFVKVAKDKKLSIKYEIALETGMRRNEIINLRWTDIDFEKSTIQIQENCKFKRVNRVIKISSNIVQLLKTHYDSKLKHDDNNQNSEFVFSSTNRKLPHINSWIKEFQMLTKEASVKNVSFNSLRLFYFKHAIR